MTKKMIKSIFSVSVVVLLVSLSIIVGILYQYFEDSQEKALKDQANVVIKGVELNGGAFIDSLVLDQYRITLIGADGKVKKDNIKTIEHMDNHFDREEFQEALKTGIGESVRYSNSMTERTMYYAKKMSNGEILRISTSDKSITSIVFGLLQPILIILLLAFLLSAILSKKMSKKIVAPLYDIDLDNIEGNDVYEEIAPLLNRISAQRKQINHQIKELARRKDEFDQITSNMSEGMILLDGNRNIVVANPAARKIFGIKSKDFSKDFILVDRNYEMMNAIDKAFATGSDKLFQSRCGREYQIDIYKIDTEKGYEGIVIFAFDITEKIFSERNRREFTANVSHELKSPLQVIIGSAELIEKEMVPKDDVPHFISNINKEAHRMVRLIEDIIKLSQLDEISDLQLEAVDIYEVTREVVNDLETFAREKNIAIDVDGAKIAIKGVRLMLYQAFYNLLNNAINYNRENGRVKISIKNLENGVLWQIKDTGIGIDESEHERIFERFYRVDKSRSKETGGTGLGLSIVKHTMNLHNAEIAVRSKVGEGTEIDIKFVL
ncbi:MAG: ATP-binding protein [Eubacteriales bacterium]|nr:ATP-binding protein [Eubacteriales bacterium]MDY3332189.1 ATP-binding protein [Gallibacter sp.]